MLVDNASRLDLSGKDRGRLGLRRLAPLVDWTYVRRTYHVESERGDRSRLLVYAARGGGASVYDGR
jgi:hypothetical protein